MSKKRRITPAMIKSAIGHNKATQTGQVSNSPRSDLVNKDYSVMERRVAAFRPEFAAPYGQTEKDKSDDQ